MKSLLPLLLVVLGFQVSAQASRFNNAYVCIKGATHFSASTKWANIEATSTNTTCVLNTETKKIYAQVEMSSFSFWNREMQEDFNECYMETDKFPHAYLEMVVIDNIDMTRNGTYDVTLKGTFELHGVTRQKEIKGVLVIKNEQPYSATAKFEVKPGDYGIKIPSIVTEKIAPVTQVDVNFTFSKYNETFSKVN